jgi:hypothetical protein
MVVGTTKIYGCRNKKTMVVGTKNMVFGTKKPNVVGTNI